jgi:hypothetical protein
MPLNGLGTLGGQQPGIVNKHVQASQPAAQLDGKGTHGGQVGHITHLDTDVGARVAVDDLLARLLTFFPVAHGEQNGSAQPGQTRGDSLADAPIRPRDQCGSASQRVCGWVVTPAQPPEAVPNAGVARDDRSVEGGIQQRPHSVKSIHGHHCPL